MLRDTPSAQGKRNDIETNLIPSGDEVKTLDEMGIKPRQSAEWQKLANVPEDEFEAAITMPGTKPSARHIIATPEPDDVPPRIAL